MKYKTDLELFFNLQQKFHKKIYGDFKKLSSKEKEEISKTLGLCLHQEVSSLINTINFKSHTKSHTEVDISNLKYEAVDAFRYIVSILNTWEINEKDFLNAYCEKDIYLNVRNKLEERKWEGQPVIIVDVDDVLAEFRSGFSKWLINKKGIDASVSSKEYYFITALSKTDENPEDIFMEFLQQGGFKNLKDVKHSMKAIKTLRKKGYWIQLLTARPKENLKCLYDTYQWIGNWTDCFDAIDFSTEKFRWCAQSEFYDSGAIKFAIDDSPKHIEEYAKHGIKTLVPLKSYNDFVSHENITFYSDPKEIINLVLEN